MWRYQSSLSQPHRCSILMVWWSDQQHDMHVMPQDVMDLRAQMAVSGAAALQRQGFLDASHEILQQYRGSAGSEAAAATAEAELRIALAQVCCFTVRMFEDCSAILMTLNVSGSCM